MESVINNLTTLAVEAGSKIALALIVFIIGNFLIKAVLKMLNKSKLVNKADGIIRTFTMSFVKISLYILLVISIIGIMGVPMASVVTVLASAGVAIGLALQGALSNLAGGIMLMIFKPFKLGDYVEAAGNEGTIAELNLFYTVLITIDNKRVTVPNGTLMNANITNYSSEELRRVDIKFTCAKGEAPSKVQDIILSVIKENNKVLSTPEPFARLNAATNESMEFLAKAWCKNEDYWDVYYDLYQGITESLEENNIKPPTIRVTTTTP